MQHGSVFTITGNKLRAARLKHGLTQAKLAEKAGLHVRSIENLERRRGDPVLASSSHAAERVAKALRLPKPQLCQSAAHAAARDMGSQRADERDHGSSARHTSPKVRPVRPQARARAMDWQDTLEAEVERKVLALQAAADAARSRRDAARIARQQDHALRKAQPKPVCGARTRKGTPCQCKKLLRGGKCKFHGGMSTGAKTPAGIAALRQAGVNTMRLRAAARAFGCRVAELTAEQRAAALASSAALTTEPSTGPTSR